MEQDLILILRMKQGNEKAWDQFVRKYYPEILKYCGFHCPDRELAEDLTQETFLRFFGALPQYQHRGKVKNYLYTIAGNLCRDQYSARHPLPLEAAGDVGRDPIPEAEERLLLGRAIRRLPEEQREVMILHYYQGLKLSEVAAILKIGLPLVKHRLRRGKELLRKELDDGSE